MENLANKFANLILAGSLFFGITSGYLNDGLKKIKNSEHVQSIRKENKEGQEFVEKYLNAKKEDKVTYAHCGQNLPLWYVDINGDKKFDGYLLHVNGSARGSNQIGLYKIKQK